MPKGEGSLGGHVIGHTRTGKPIYAARAVPHLPTGVLLGEGARRHEAAAKHAEKINTDSPEVHEDRARKHEQGARERTDIFGKEGHAIMAAAHLKVAAHLRAKRGDH